MLPVVIEKGKFKLYDIRKLVLVKWNYCHIDVKSDMGYKKQWEFSQQIKHLGRLFCGSFLNSVYNYQKIHSYLNCH